MSVRGWVLYDASCGFCSKWVPYWAKTLEKRNYSYAPIQSNWVFAKTKRSEEELLRDIQLLLADGTLISSSAAYLYMMKRIWWSWPLWVLFSLPGFRWVFDRCYKAFNRNRHSISKACKLE